MEPPFNDRGRGVLADEPAQIGLGQPMILEEEEVFRVNGVTLRGEPIHQDIARGRGSGGHPRAGRVTNFDGIWLEPFLIRLNGVVDRRVDHGKVEERRRPGWTSTGEDGFSRDHVQPLIGSAAAGAAHIRQLPMMRPVSLRSPVMVPLFLACFRSSSRIEHTALGSRCRGDLSAAVHRVSSLRSRSALSLPRSIG